MEMENLLRNQLCNQIARRVKEKVDNMMSVQAYMSRDDIKKLAENIISQIPEELDRKSLLGGVIFMLSYLIEGYDEITLKGSRMFIVNKDRVSKEIFEKDWFDPAREIEFEGITVTVPAKSEEILTQIYGDYMTPPPVNEQVCPHQYIVKEK